MYVRLGLGNCNLNSIGERVVFEIWPPGHFSPIHDHGMSHGVIWML